MRFHRFQWEDERLIDFDRLYRDDVEYLCIYFLA